MALTDLDRCDRCGARAYVRAELVAGDLFFCAHHGREHFDGLVLSAATVHDESAALA